METILSVPWNPVDSKPGQGNELWVGAHNGQFLGPGCHFPDLTEGHLETGTA